MEEYWNQKIGNQRDWIWRGWQIRYSYFRANQEKTNNPPVIFLHGFGAAIEHWRHNLPVVKEYHPVYAIDLLGFGGSSKVSTNYNIYLWVDLIYDFWGTFINRPVILVGNSLGSLISLVATANHPEMATGLVMINIPDISLRQKAMPQWLLPIVTNIENLVASPLLLKILFKIVRSPKLIRRWLEFAYYDKRVVTDELVEIVSVPPQDIGAAETFISLFAGVRTKDFAPSVDFLLSQLKIPILLIWGKQDRMIPPSLGPILAKLNQQIKLVEIADAGHCPQDECYQEFNYILNQWLEEYHYH